MQSRSNTGAPYAQHDRKKLVREMEIIAIQAIVRHQQPDGAAEAGATKKPSAIAAALADRTFGRMCKTPI